MRLRRREEEWTFEKRLEEGGGSELRKECMEEMRRECRKGKVISDSGRREGKGFLKRGE